MCAQHEHALNVHDTIFRSLPDETFDGFEQVFDSSDDPAGSGRPIPQPGKKPKIKLGPI
jgi:hypothetical protein